jgi:hypothetical protein
MSPWKFAELGYAGLEHKTRIQRHRLTWKLAMEDGLTADVVRDEPVTIPDADWHEYYDRSGKWKVPDSVAELLAETTTEPEAEPPSISLMRHKRFQALANTSSKAMKNVNELRVWGGQPDPGDMALLEQARDQFGAARDGLDEIVSREPVS